jgi:hypothetical protein
VETLAQYGTAIQAWLAGEEQVDDLIIEADREASTEAVKVRQTATQVVAHRARVQSENVTSAVIHEPRSRAGFSIEHRGGEAIVLFNEEHPFSKRILSADSADELRDLIVSMLAAYGRARHAIEDDADEGLLDLLEHEWAERLASSARRTSGQTNK